MKEKKLKIEKENKKIFDFKGLLKSFTSVSQQELTEEEVILNDDSLSAEEKKELVAGLKNNQTLAHKLFSDSLKVAKNLNLKNDVSAQKSKINIRTNSYKNNNEKELDKD